MIVKIDNQRASKLANMPGWYVVYIQVQGAANVRVAVDAQTLEQNSGADVQGLQIDATDRIKRLIWKGPMYAIASASNAVINVETIEGYNPATQ